MKSKGELILETHLNAYKIPFVTEYRFHPVRKWRFDFAFPLKMLAVEIEGGIWTEGRHTRPKGYINDLDKYNAAQIYGWRLLRFTPQQVKSGEAIDQIMKVLKEIISHCPTRYAEGYLRDTTVKPTSKKRGTE